MNLFGADPAGFAPLYTLIFYYFIKYYNMSKVSRFTLCNQTTTHFISLLITNRNIL